MNRIDTLKKIFFFLTISVLLAACSREKSNKASEGIIIYDVSFPYSQDDPLVNIYPNEMLMEFKDDKIRIELNSFGNFVSTKLIVDHSEKKFCQLLKDFKQNKYSLMLDEAGVEEMMAHQPAWQIEHTDEHREIAGFNCQVSKAHSIDSEYDVRLYHTSEIDIKDPNWFTGFGSVKEVLLGYEIEEYGVRMRLLAKEVRFEKIPDDRFSLPENYTSQDLAQMRSHFQEIIDSFQR